MDGAAARLQQPDRYSDTRLAESFSVYVLFTEPVGFTNRDMLDAVREDYPELSWSDAVAEGRVDPGNLDGVHTTGEVVVISLFPDGAENKPTMIPLVSLPGRCDIDWEPIFQKNRPDAGGPPRGVEPRFERAIDTVHDHLHVGVVARDRRAPPGRSGGFCQPAGGDGGLFPQRRYGGRARLVDRGAKSALKGEVPFFQWITLGVDPVPDGRDPVPVTAQTIGVAAFTGHEMLLPLTGMPPDEAAKLVFGAAVLHLRYGNHFTDGDTLGPEDDPTLKLRIRHAPEGTLGLQTDTWVFLHPDSTLAPREEALFGKCPGIPPPPGMDVTNFGDANRQRNKFCALVAGPRRKRRTKRH